MSVTDPHDRRVHAVLADGSKVVRYDKAGRWYQEWPADVMIQRRVLRLKAAVALAAGPGVTRVHFGLPGGERFDREVHKAHADWAEANGDHS